MLWEAVILALKAIRRNALRSFLTILGIVIGVSAVIAMVTLGSGTTAQVASDISKLGSNLLTLRPGQAFRGPGGVRASARALDVKDAQAIAEQVNGVVAISPTASQSVTAVFGNDNRTTALTGADNDYFTASNLTIARGRQFTDNELRGGRTVCVLGETVRKELFGAREAIGATIRLNKVSCEVIGLLVPKGQSTFGQDQDDMIVTPLRALQRRFTGNRDERRRIGPGAEDDFNVFDMTQITATLTGTTRLLTGLLGAVAAVSLLVGGIGIMNIMLVSVTERTREIGIRLAIGALERQVLMQFLVEAMVLSLLGGLIGIAVGLGLAAGSRCRSSSSRRSSSSPSCSRLSSASSSASFPPAVPRGWTRSRPCGTNSANRKERGRWMPISLRFSPRFVPWKGTWSTSSRRAGTSSPSRCTAGRSSSRRRCAHATAPCAPASRPISGGRRSWASPRPW
jgi:putative ABC transport system permease protein